MTQPIASWSDRRRSPSKRWRLTQYVGRFVLEDVRGTQEFNGDEAASLSVGRFWSVLVLKVGSCRSRRRLHGLGRSQSRSLTTALAGHMQRQRMVHQLEAAVRWRTDVESAISNGTVLGRWIPEETLHNLETAVPPFDLRAWLDGGGDALAASLSVDERQAIELTGVDLRARVADVNEAIVQAELETRKDFFDKVERSPLTEEQARAVVCFDNRVRVIAAAGSGKTSVMVARAAYAIERGFVRPERCLLLAFNRAAAIELQERIGARLGVLGLASAGLRASTFHAFGLGVIGEATGRKPRLAPWLDGDQDVEMVSRIVDELRDRSLDFRFKWDVFRLMYARVSDDPTGGEPDSWDSANRRSGFKTFNGEVVKSQGEQLIANWLFLNGVDYVYEHPYAHDVAGPDHSQYRPDFYYPDIDVWHEHWAIGWDGEPPDSFAGYARSMEWKKQLHESHGTTLVETTWAQIMDTDGFRQLASELESRGITRDWNPDRTIPGAQPLKHEELAALVRTFMTHVKSNSLTPDSVAQRLVDGPALFRYPRTRLFIDLYWQIHGEWQARLEAGNSIDFEDMLVRAADHLEAGDVTRRYDLVLVDEFQDASHARARLTRALVGQPGKYLLAVGDDWQSINRFAGADLSVMTDFESWFGPGQTLRLETTFRCPQSISDVASSFVTKNPRQLRKKVKSGAPDPGLPVNVRLVEAPEQALQEYVHELADRIRAGDVPNGTDAPVSVDVLGRYNFDRQLMPKDTPSELKVVFRTVHGSKGLEADYVVIPNLADGVYGFPSQLVNDPLLDVVMADPDDFPDAEERRLFYVALTRARREVTLIAERGRESRFLAELVEQGLVTVRDDSSSLPIRGCPMCLQGMLIQRSGPYGDFYGCSRFPRCPYKEKIFVPGSGAPPF